MTKEQIQRVIKIWGKNYKPSDVPVLWREERENYMKDKYTPDLEELDGHAEEVSGKAEEAEDKLRYQ